MPLESSIATPAPRNFPWGTVKAAGSLVPVSDVNEPFDWVKYSERDKQLAFRDLTLASGIAVVSIEASSIWNVMDAQLLRPVLPSPVANNPLSNNPGDLPALISPSGTVRHMTGSDIPSAAALRVDKELFARDLIVFENLARAADVINVTPYTGTNFSEVVADPPVVALANGGTILPTISNAWSLAQGTISTDDINPSLPLNTELFKRPDTNLAARDNILANYSAHVEKVLKDPFAFATRMLVEVTVNQARESETYVLVEETIQFKIFATEPLLPGRLRIVYNKQLKTVQWVTEDPLAIHLPQTQPFILGSVTIDGIESGQKVTFVPARPGKKDAMFWRQKSAKINFAPKILQHFELYPKPADVFVSGQGIRSFSDLVLPRAGTVRFQLNGNWPQGFHRVNVLFKPLPELVISGNQTLDTSIGTSDQGMNFPLTGGTARWSFTLPPGAWNLKLHFTNTGAGTAPSEFGVTTAVTGMLTRTGGLRFAVDGFETGEEAISEIPITSTGNPQVISITWTPTTGSTAQLKIFQLQFVSILETAISYDVAGRLISGSSQQGSDALATLAARRYRPDVVAFNFFTEGVVSNPFFDLELLTNTDTIFAIEQIHVQQLVNLDVTPNAAGFAGIKGEFLSRAHESVLDSYATYITRFPSTDFRSKNSDGSAFWNTSANTSWISALKQIEPRVDQAFRQSRCGDIGRPALLPEGLELILRSQGLLTPGSVRANYAASLGMPVLRPLQAWMVRVGVYVAHEDFWDTEDLGQFPNPALDPFVILSPIEETSSETVALDPSTLDVYVYEESGPGSITLIASETTASFESGELFPVVILGGTYFEDLGEFGTNFVTGSNVVGFDTGTLFPTTILGGTYFELGTMGGTTTTMFFGTKTSGSNVVSFDTGTLFPTVVLGGTYFELGTTGGTTTTSFFGTHTSGSIFVAFDTGTLFESAVHGLTYTETGTFMVIFDTGTLT